MVKFIRSFPPLLANFLLQHHYFSEVRASNVLAQKRPGGVHDGYQVHLVQYREQLGRGKTRRKGKQSKHCRQKGKHWGRLLGVGQCTGMTWASVPVLHTPSTHRETRSGERCQTKRMCNVARSPWLMARRNI